MGESLITHHRSPITHYTLHPKFNTMNQQQVEQIFEQKHKQPHRIFAAPGRINLIGEHTDYNEGFVMPAAIDKRIYLAIAPVPGNKVEIYSADFDETVTFSLNQALNDMPHWAKYPYGVVRELEAAGHTLQGFCAVFGGDIPKGAGLSSSAALESVFAVALNTLFSLNIDNMTLARIGQRAEHNYAGVKCGIMDQFASIHGKKDHVMMLDCRSLEYEYRPLKLDGFELILADTRVKHSLASSEYNLRRHQCEEGVMVLRTQMPAVRSLRDVRPKDVYPYREMMGEEVFMRCEYVTEENQRVKEMARALEEDDMPLAGELLFASHHGLSNKYHVSCPELDLLVDIARNTPGILGARMMGGGFGGCTINLVSSDAAEQFKESAYSGFKKQFGTEPLFYKVNLSQGATEC